MRKVLVSGGDAVCDRGVDVECRTWHRASWRQGRQNHCGGKGPLIAHNVYFSLKDNRPPRRKSWWPRARST